MFVYNYRQLLYRYKVIFIHAKKYAFEQTYTELYHAYKKVTDERVQYLDYNVFYQPIRSDT